MRFQGVTSVFKVLERNVDGAGIEFLLPYYLADEAVGKQGSN